MELLAKSYSRKSGEEEGVPRLREIRLEKATTAKVYSYILTGI